MVGSAGQMGTWRRQLGLSFLSIQRHVTECWGKRNPAEGLVPGSVLGHGVYREPSSIPQGDCRHQMSFASPWRCPGVPDPVPPGLHSHSPHPPFSFQLSSVFFPLFLEVEEVKIQEFSQIILMLFKCNKTDDFHIRFSNILSPGG